MIPRWGIVPGASRIKPSASSMLAVDRISLVSRAFVWSTVRILRFRAESAVVVVVLVLGLKSNGALKLYRCLSKAKPS